MSEVIQKERILGIDVCVNNKQDLIDALISDINANNKRFVVAINPEKILKAKNDQTLTHLLNSADYQIPDGIGVVLASKLQKGYIKNRITGINMMEVLCHTSIVYNFRIFLFGAKPAIVKKAKEKLESQYKGISIVGYADGYQTNSKNVIKKINASQADIVFVALGSPKQEYWIFQNARKINAPLLQGVGGSFDVISGKVKRAPRFMQKLGLEWLYRLIKQPKRIFRQAKIVKFLFMLIKDKKNEN